MNQQNPYMNLYLNNLNNTKETVSKEYLYTLAINLGQVHNVLGVMISDVVNLMGNFSFNQQKNKSQQQSNFRNNDFSQQQIKIKNKNGQKQIKIKNQSKSNQYFPQKMEIENLPIDSYNDKMKSDQIIKKQFLLNEFQFNQKKQPKQNSNQQPKKQIFSDIFYQFGSKIDETTKKQQKQEDQISSRTISAEKVRYNQKYENQFQRDLDHKVKYQVKVKEVKEKQNINKKPKSIFFDLFDSSQTNSNPLEQQQDFIQKFSPIRQQKSFNSNLFYTKQANEKSNSNSSNFLKPKTGSYSTQIKDNKIKEKSQNTLKSYNLLQQTFLVSSPKPNLINIEQIDEIETSNKKVPEKIVIKKKVEDKKKPVKSDENFDNYIPRREEIGRKKVNRENVKGSQCPDCKAFYDAISDDSKSFRNICECTSRHKSSTTYMNKHTVQNYSQAFSLD